MNDTALKTLFSSENNNLDVVYLLICLIVIAILVFNLPFLYKKIRCKFPVTVNCWFCNKYTRVPYEEANCWACPFCEQYNGFNKDGGYNKVIKEQYCPSLNHNIYNIVAKDADKKETKHEKSNSNGLCRLCNINQQLKIHQLAHFVPLNEKNYDHEVEQFKQQLEKAYALCSSCEKTLKEKLQTQQYNLLKDRLNDQKEKYQFFKLHNYKYLDYRQILYFTTRTLCSGLKLISGMISFIMFVSFVFQLETEQNFLKNTLPANYFLELQSFLPEIVDYLMFSYKRKQEFISLGLLCYALSLFFRQRMYDHPRLLLLWGILCVLSRSEMTVLQVLTSAACLSLTMIEIQMMPNCTLKKISRNKSETVENEENNLFSRLIPDKVNADFTEQMCRTRRQMNGTTELPNVTRGSRIKESRAELASNESPIVANPMNSIPKKTNEHVTARSKSVFSKSFLASLDRARVDKELSPPPEIVNTLHNLHISNSSGKSEKPSNFLFEKHSFDEKSRKTSPVIKSPKFVKPEINYWSNGELNESSSRSSTPSSGCSVRKPNGTSPRQNAFQYPKFDSTFSFSRRSPADNFHYPCYSPNFHYCSPRFVPSPEFSRLSHGTACRSPSLCVVMSPQRLDFTDDSSFSLPSVGSPHPIELNAWENEFRNANRNCQCNQKSRVKNFFVNVSVFLNFLSTSILVYCIYTGVISLTGN